MITPRDDTGRLLSSADQKTYEAMLRGFTKTGDERRQDHAIRTRVTIRNRQEDEVGTWVGSVLEGQIDFDAGTTPTRTGQIALLDPKRKLEVSDDSPAAGDIWPSSFISIERHDWCAALGGWVCVPVLWGPITGFKRTWPEVEITAAGKELLAVDPHLMRDGIHFARGTLKTTAIRRLLERQGEGRFDLGTSTGKIGGKHGLSIPRFAEAWKESRHIASGLNRQLFYNGEGRAKLRQYSGNEVWTFQEGMLLSEPDISYDFKTFRNFVMVLGGKPKEGKPRVTAWATLVPEDPLSPQSLGRNGNPRYLITVIENEEIKRQSAAQDLANRTLRGAVYLGRQVDVDVAPVPHLEEFDDVVIKSTGFSIKSPMRQWTLPLNSDSMSFGYNKNVRWNVKIRHKKGRKRH